MTPVVARTGWRSRKRWSTTSDTLSVTPRAEGSITSASAEPLRVKLGYSPMADFGPLQLRVLRNPRVEPMSGATRSTLVWLVSSGSSVGR